MSMNPSQYLKAVIGLFFCFYLVFRPSMAQAKVFQKMAQSFSNVSEAQKYEVFGIVEKLGVDPKNLSKKDIKTLVHALDNPMHLVDSFLPEPSFTGLDHLPYFFEPDFYRAFFFSRFDLYKDSDTLFTKLFSKKSGNQWKELSFERAEKNWRSFLNVARNANREGYTKITEIDLEASAISFVHQRFSDKYFPNLGVWGDPRYWEEYSLGVFFNNQLTIAHYINPHFTLTPEDPYHYLIMKMIRDRSFVRQGENYSLINSKDFILRIWRDATEEISRHGTAGVSSSVFLEHIIKSVIECRTPPISSLWNHPFLKAMVEAARENNRLTQLVQLFGTIERFVADSNLEYWGLRIPLANSDPVFIAGIHMEAFRSNVLEQLRKIPDSITDQVVYDFLFHTDLEDSVLHHSRHSDPADAGVHL